MTRDRIHHVLFLCTGNSARSILAEAVLNRAGPDPAAVEGSAIERAAAFADTLRALDERIARLLALPLASLDTAERRRRLAHIRFAR